MMRRLQLAAMGALFLSNMVHAAFPDKPFRVIVPSGAGGPAELCMRAVTEVMRVDLGQHFVIENVPGAFDR